MSFPHTFLERLSEAQPDTVPPPLVLPSPNISPSQSWKSVTGSITIILDPALAASSSGETLRPCDSETSISYASSVASVGTFGQPLPRGQAQQPEELSLEGSAKIKTWGNVESELCFSSASVTTLNNFSPSQSNFHSTADFESLSSPVSTPTSTSFSSMNGTEERDLHSAKKSPASTLPVFREEDEAGRIQCNQQHTTPVIFNSHFPQGSQDSSKLLCGFTLSSSFDCDPPQSLLSARHVTAGKSVFPPPISKARTNVTLKRKKSDLDVPLSPVSTFVLSPSTSTSSQEKRDLVTGILSTSNIPFPYKYQNAHYRAASAPLLPHHSDGIDNFMDLRSTSLGSRHSTSSSRNFRFASNGFAPEFQMPDDCNSHGSQTTSDTRFMIHGHPIPKTYRPNSKSSSTARLTAPDWLHDSIIELWIDQEGFRSIQPRFSLVQYWKDTGLGADGETLDVAEFEMKKRQTWHFHYAAFDGPPVLRRLTINGDMNDYISRQAALTLKHNGVYAVESTEDKGKAAWKFEYLIEDRLTPETGKIMYGEKRFTPLRFVCNPEMLTPEHGKKVKLLHFVKKSVTPKLQSFKLDEYPNPTSMRSPVVKAETNDKEEKDPGKMNDNFAFPPDRATELRMDSKVKAKSRSISPISLDASRERIPLRHYQIDKHVEVLVKEDDGHPELLVFSDMSADQRGPSPIGQRIVSPTVINSWFPPPPPHHYDGSLSSSP